MPFPQRGQKQTFVGRKAEPGPKTCTTCKTRAYMQDSIMCDGYVRRRYHCTTCPARWTTYEVREEDTDMERSAEQKHKQYPIRDEFDIPPDVA